MNKRVECRISHFVESVNSKSHIVYYLWTHFVCATIINICIECYKEHQDLRLKWQIIKRGLFWHCSLLLFISELICCVFFLCCSPFFWHSFLMFHSTQYSLSFRRLLLVWNMIRQYQEALRGYFVLLFKLCIGTFKLKCRHAVLIRSIDRWHKQQIILRKIEFYDLS